MLEVLALSAQPDLKAHLALLDRQAQLVHLAQAVPPVLLAPQDQRVTLAALEMSALLAHRALLAQLEQLVLKALKD